MESFNRTLEAMFTKLVKVNQRDWDGHLPKGPLAYHYTAVLEAMLFTLYHLVSPIQPVDVMLDRPYLPMYCLH